MIFRPETSDQSLTAVLGPTNTGKTYLAMERMLGHESGMMGFPLRLLARENYDRAVAIKGAAAVALVTGEEKIVPATARYFICTVESMPVDRDVAFLAVDEIQLASDRERGHIFTDRLLHARGRLETMFLGSETVRPLIRKLVPGVNFVTRPRFSKITYSGSKKLTRLPRRSAVVAFSVSEVYGIADLLRRQRGGTAVVMGALSPRTRNAQVALYQSGEVDYLVATDAIGMGLNMDVDHVAFAALSKFDGRAPRPLTAPELSQIAGRAGRHMNDGTFGVTAEASALDSETIARIETHEFQALKSVYWRNTDLRYVSVESLLSGLKKPPPSPGLIRPPATDDQLVLEILAQDSDIQERAKGQERVRLLWDTAQVPDFRKLRPETHARLIKQVYQHLSGSKACIPEDWISLQIDRVKRTQGDIHALMDRIAEIRTWTYLANRPGWVENASHWQGETRVIEDQLSDALHEKLTQQFIDHRTAHLVKRLKGIDRMDVAVTEAGRVEIDGHFIGDLDGLIFMPDKTGLKTADRAVANTADTALLPELERRAQLLIDAEDTLFILNDAGGIEWTGAVVATLSAGVRALSPKVVVRADERLNPTLREKLGGRLQSWLDVHASKLLAPLFGAETAELSGAARGIAFQLCESLGAVDRNDADAQVRALTEDDKKALARCKIRFGLNAIYIPDILKAGPIRLRAILWAVFKEMTPKPPLPPAGRVSFPTDADVTADYYRAAGFRPIRGMAYRVDMLERFSAEVRRLLREKVAVLPPEQLSPLGIGAEKAVILLNALGFASSLEETGIAIAVKRKPARHKKPKAKTSESPKEKTQTKRKPVHNKKPEKMADPDSPFAVLKTLVKP
ncbi:MAG: helicase-related protein [Rhodospirillaceae bacterium]